MRNMTLMQSENREPDDSRSWFNALPVSCRSLNPREDLVRQGETAHGFFYFVTEGFLCRYKLLSGGRRTILAYLLPGDFCGPHPDLCGPMDHSIGGLTKASLTQIPRTAFQEALSANADLARNLATVLVAETAIQRQWLANMSCPSDKRLAHLLCELRTRLARAGLADERGFLLPLTQQELGEALGISTVHVNRTLQFLKDSGLVRITGHQVKIAALAMLERFAKFDPAYLGAPAGPLAVGFPQTAVK